MREHSKPFILVSRPQPVVLTVEINNGHGSYLLSIYIHLVIIYEISSTFFLGVVFLPKNMLFLNWFTITHTL